MARFTKNDIEVHSDGNGYRYAHPAVKVKVYKLGCETQEVMDKFGCTEEVAEKAIGYAWESAQEQFWGYWGDTTGGLENGLYGSSEYAYFPGEVVEVYSEGRSSGWLVVHGLPPVEEWDAVMLSRWNRFQTAVLSDVKYRISKEMLMEDIESNQWALPHADKHNFADTDKGTVCIATAKEDIINYGQEKWGFVPNLP